MSEQKAITTPAKSIFAYSEADLKAAKALKMMLPYGSKLTDDNAIALLLYGKLHGLDPLNGECYFLVREKVDQKTGERVREELGCYPGVKGKRKKAREQINKQQGTYKIEFSICDPAILGLDKSQVSVCMKGELRDTITSGQYILDAIKLKHEGFDQAFIDMVIGKPPAVVGYGVVKNSEINYIKMAPAQLARKRAETDCLTQRFDLPFADDTETSGIDYVDADYTAEDAPALPEKSYAPMPASLGSEPPPARKTEEQIMLELGFSGQQ